MRAESVNALAGVGDQLRGIFYDEELEARFRQEEASSPMCYVFQRDFADEFAGGWSAAGLALDCTPFEARPVVMRLLNSRGHPHDSLDHEFLRMIGATIAVHGKIDYQLIEKPGETPYLMSLMPGTLHSFAGRAVQIVQRSGALPLFRVLERTTLYTIGQPYASPRAWRQRVLAMAAIDRDTTLATLAAQGNKYSGFFDFDEQRLRAGAAMIDEMAFIDWPTAETLRSPAMSRYYYALKLIRFKLNVRKIRKRAIDVMNHVLSDVGPGCGFQATLSFADVVGEGALLDLQRRLTDGTADPSELRSIS